MTVGSAILIVIGMLSGIFIVEPIYQWFNDEFLNDKKDKDKK